MIFVYGLCVDVAVCLLHTAQQNDILASFTSCAESQGSKGKSAGPPRSFLSIHSSMFVCLHFKVCKKMSELFKILVDSPLLLYCLVLIPSVASDTHNIKTLSYKGV